MALSKHIAVPEMGNTRYIFTKESYVEYMDLCLYTIFRRANLKHIFLEWGFLCV